MGEKYEISILIDEEEEWFLKNSEITVLSLGEMDLNESPEGGEIFRISRIMPGKGETMEYFKIVHIDEKSVPKRIILKRKGGGNLN